MTNKYIVSSTIKGINKTALVSSGNSRGALFKFLFNMHSNRLHCTLTNTPVEKMTKSGHITNYMVHGKIDFVVSVTKINMHDDFIPITDVICSVCKKEKGGE